MVAVQICCIGGKQLLIIFMAKMDMFAKSSQPVITIFELNKNVFSQTIIRRDIVVIDNLITAYRAEIYDMRFSELRKIIKENWKVMLLLLITIFLLGVCIYGLIQNNSMVMLVFIVLASITLIMADRCIVGTYKTYIQRRNDRLNKLEEILLHAIPGINLSQKEIMDEIIQRLTERIEKRVPFKNLLGSLGSFSKVIVLPVITYVAGAYSSSLEQITINVVAAYAIAIVIICGVIRLSWELVSRAAKVIFCRDYHAAIALREDLLDLHLQHSLSSNVKQQ